MTDAKKATILATKEQEINHLKRQWDALRNNEWNESLLEELYSALRRFASQCALDNFDDLNDAGFSIEVYLSSFIGTNSPPNQKQFDDIDKLFNILNTDLEKEEEMHDAIVNNIVYILDENKKTDQSIINALKEKNLDVELFSNINKLISSVNQKQPYAIIIEADSKTHINTIKKTTKASLVLLNGSNHIKKRLSLMHLGINLYLVAADNEQKTTSRLLDFLKIEDDEKHKVLIVEDDISQAQFAASILEKSKVKTRIVTSPLEVIEVMEVFQPNLILMDLYMPEANGLELTAIIRDNNTFFNIPIIFLSGEQDSNIQMEALTAGGDDFLIKPIKPKHLVDLVNLRIKRSLKSVPTQKIMPKSKPSSTTTPAQTKLDNEFKDALTSINNTEEMAVLCVKPDQLELISKDKLATVYKKLNSIFITELNSSDKIHIVDKVNFILLIKKPLTVNMIDFTNNLKYAICSTIFDSGIKNKEFSISIGVHLVSPSDTSTEAIYQAKKALDQAIDSGGNLVFDSSQLNNQKEHEKVKSIPLETIVKKAFEEEKIEIQYQPLLDVTNNQVANYKVIPFIKTSNNKKIDINRIQETALKLGIQSQIDRYLVSNTITMIKKMYDSGIQSNVFIQQSISSIMDDEYPKWIRNQLRKNQIVGTGLILEFKLSDTSKDLKGARRNFGLLRELGIEISLANFSDKEGASKVLKYLHANYANIANRFLLAKNETIDKMVADIHQAKAKIIVSNMDTPQSLSLHWSAGADLLQGHLIQSPMDKMDYDFSQVAL